MPKRRSFEGNIVEIEKAMKEAAIPALYRRIQCVYLAMLYPDMPASQISKITLYSESHVRNIHADYRKNGLAGLGDNRGGRYRENLTLEEEVLFLKPFEEASKKGSLIVAGPVKKAYEEKIGRSVPKSTIYRMLDRHGYRKITPYRRHKKANKEEQEAFKKTLQI